MEEGVDIAVLYGPGYDMWVEGIDPDLQAGMARAYNRWAEEMRETSGGKVLSSGPVPLNPWSGPCIRDTAVLSAS